MLLCFNWPCGVSAKWDPDGPSWLFRASLSVQVGDVRHFFVLTVLGSPILSPLTVPGFDELKDLMFTHWHWFIYHFKLQNVLMPTNHGKSKMVVSSNGGAPKLRASILKSSKWPNLDDLGCHKSRKPSNRHCSCCGFDGLTIYAWDIIGFRTPTWDVTSATSSSDGLSYLPSNMEARRHGNFTHHRRYNWNIMTGWAISYHHRMSVFW